jgi:hypothetical protein
LDSRLQQEVGDQHIEPQQCVRRVKRDQRRIGLGDRLNSGCAGVDDDTVVKDERAINRGMD